jgi:hypothetical protein
MVVCFGQTNYNKQKFPFPIDPSIFYVKIAHFIFSEKYYFNFHAQLYRYIFEKAVRFLVNFFVYSCHFLRLYIGINEDDYMLATLILAL